MNQNPTPNPHNFKVLDTQTGEYVTQDSENVFMIDKNGDLCQEWIEYEQGGLRTTGFWSAGDHLRAVFPHEERALEFAPREGESFVDRCNRLFPVDSEVWIDLDGSG